MTVNVVQVAEAVIPEVHAREISEAHAIPRDERFAPTQRAPSEATAEAHSKSEAAAKPGN
jgi:hypothetical protein